MGVEALSLLSHQRRDVEELAAAQAVHVADLPQEAQESEGCGTYVVHVRHGGGDDIGNKTEDGAVHNAERVR